MRGMMSLLVTERKGVERDHSTYKLVAKPNALSN
jgi:hypothetical protein